MAVVKEYTDENCKIKIDDKYCVRTKEEAQKILDEAARLYSEYFSERPEEYKE
jgi:hypothetical protein